MSLDDFEDPSCRSAGRRTGRGGATATTNGPQLPSLQHYVLVERDKPHIEIVDRQEAWGRVADDLEAVLELPAIGIEIPLAEIYADVIV